ncbi:hypothetical protein [Roseateles sp.]|uniref:carboxymuconolactone decarboxylase family protein n=1 Tax=Roseateles sp. TaxID=1971397 RepID=UPI0025CE467F|nr:hypothetical protein [Roseateles sp.]
MFIAQPESTPATEKVYKSSADSQGFVMNLTKAWAWRPDVFDGFAALRSELTSQSTLSKRELTLLVCATASELGDAYCALAWGRTLAQSTSEDVAAAVISDLPSLELGERDQALTSWARKVVRDPNATTAADVQSLRDSGLSEREIFEATLFVAFRLAFSTVNDALGVKPDRELVELVPKHVRAAIDFGRSADA